LTRAIRGIAQAPATLDAWLLDLAVSESRSAAVAGSLTLEESDPAELLGQVRPCMASYPRHILHIGAIDLGAAIKLASTKRLHINHLIVLEAVSVANSQAAKRRPCSRSPTSSRVERASPWSGECPAA
jgi:3-hydroxyisobutyrate dehydrogenase-like beta-hydroxyacid dehydrogenase